MMVVIRHLRLYVSMENEMLLTATENDGNKCRKVHKHRANIHMQMADRQALVHIPITESLNQFVSSHLPPIPQNPGYQT